MAAATRWPATMVAGGDGGRRRLFCREREREREIAEREMPREKERPVVRERD